jgi:predicted MFS family arabinose efflux permease
MRKTQRTLIVIALSTLLMSMGFRVWQSIFNNFAVEDLAIQAEQIGVVQAVREIPGLVGFLVGMLALVLIEMRIAGISVIVMGAGIILTGSAQNFAGLLAATLFMSVGFHFFSSSRSAALLLTVGREEAPQILGRFNSLGAIASVVGTAFIFATLDAWGYRTLFRILGAVVMIGGLALLPFGQQEARLQRTGWRTTIRRRYWLYYVLQFLGGSRRHIFTTFATFLLVQEYQVTGQVVALLFLINSLVGTYLHQALGKIVGSYGERRVLTVNFGLLVFIFLGYALIPLSQALAEPTFEVPQVALGTWVLSPAFAATPGLLILLVFFIVDQILFGFSIALQSYFQKMAVSPQEITPNVSLGQTINHMAAVVIPIVGGSLWVLVGAQYTFFFGVLVALLALWLTQYMHITPPEPGGSVGGTRDGWSEPQRAR